MTDTDLLIQNLRRENEVLRAELEWKQKEIELARRSSGVTVREWISVTERLPESGKESVLIALRWGEVDIGWCEDGRWRSEFVNEYEEGEVTHWMPLPNPPKEE